MGRKHTSESDRARRVVAQEAARIIVNQGVRDYRVAKQKAAGRLGLNGRSSLPGNAEIEAAVAEHLQIFGGNTHDDHLRLLRVAALSAMGLLAAFAPRLIGPVLAGTADENSAVNLHVFSDSCEAVSEELATIGISYRPYERKLRISRSQLVSFAGFEFHHSNSLIQATVFPVNGIRQAPLSPIDGKPMRRLDSEGVQGLLEHI